jgi:hypothetical protein
VPHGTRDRTDILLRAQYRPSSDLALGCAIAGPSRSQFGSKLVAIVVAYGEPAGDIEVFAAGGELLRMRANGLFNGPGSLQALRPRLDSCWMPVVAGDVLRGQDFALTVRLRGGLPGTAVGAAGPVFGRSAHEPPTPGESDCPRRRNAWLVARRSRVRIPTRLLSKSPAKRGVAVSVPAGCFRGHSIGLTLASMKAISSESSPYLVYSCWSICGIDLDQSMSEADVKSCRGTYFQALAGLC